MATFPLHFSAAPSPVSATLFLTSELSCPFLTPAMSVLGPTVSPPLTWAGAESQDGKLGAVWGGLIPLAAGDSAGETAVPFETEAIGKFGERLSVMPGDGWLGGEI